MDPTIPRYHLTNQVAAVTGCLMIKSLYEKILKPGVFHTLVRFLFKSQFWQSIMCYGISEYGARLSNLGWGEKHFLEYVNHNW